MRLVIDNAPQGSPEWYKARAGHITSSRASCITAKPKTKGGPEATTRRDYRVQIVSELLTGEPQEDGFVSRHMLAGKENEPRARRAYDARTGNIALEGGFARLTSIRAGASLDGFVDDDGFVEIKCPKPATHIEYLLRARVPPEHLAQILHQFWITDRAWCDFVSYCPSLPAHLQLLVVRLDRAEVQNELHAYIGEAMQFLAEVKVLETQLLKKAA